MTAPSVDVVLARGASGTSAARAAAALSGEVGAAVRLFVNGADRSGIEAAGSGEYVAVFAPNVVPLPGAISRMLEAMAAAPRAVVVLATAVPADLDGTGDREAMRADTARHRTRVARFPGSAFVAVYGADEVGAALYRRSALPAGRLEALLAGDPASIFDLHAGGPCRVVADPLCVRLGDRREAPMARRVAAALDRLRAFRRLRPADAGSPISMASAALVVALGLEGAVGRLREARRRTWQRLRWRALLPLGGTIHDFLLTHFAGWPIGRTPPGPVRRPGPRKIAYYLWRFPVLSETFIRRELGALGEAGVDVAILADRPGTGAADDPELVPLARRTQYVLPVAPAAALRDLAAAVVRHPLRTANLFAYTCFRPYSVPKSPSQDAAVFLKAVRVAALLRRTGATHLHSPWGDTNAFIGMVAARLARVDFSVQFRAQDLHRRTLAFEVPEKIRNARFVVTNTRYNLEHLRSLAAPEDRAKIRQIYNGLELGRFAPADRPRERPDGPVRILSVARLIEPKGLPYLFEACRLLIDRGRDLRCAVIGGPELPLYVNDLIEIRRSRRRLDLDDVVDMRGPQPFARVLEAYTAADVFALPCVVGADASNDIIPNVILEAMAMGVPVVATRITAIPELIEDGESGLLVPPNDARALADAIERLIDDPALAARLAANARARIAERFDLAKNVRAYVALFGSP